MRLNVIVIYWSAVSASFQYALYELHLQHQCWYRLYWYSHKIRYGLLKNLELFVILHFRTIEIKRIVLFGLIQVRPPYVLPFEPVFIVGTSHGSISYVYCASSIRWCPFYVKIFDKTLFMAASNFYTVEVSSILIFIRRSG